MRKMIAALLLLIICGTTMAQPTVVPDDNTRRLREAFQDRKFGIFIHWGIYSMLADGEWAMHSHRLPAEEYSTLAGGFYPSWFSAREWVDIFKDAGAQYITFTSRHHDGFSMWETKTSDYNIVDATPYHRDILKTLSEECAMQNMKLHLYYSHMDWFRPDYPRGSSSKNVPYDPTKEDWASYYNFMNQQLTELLTKYGNIGAIWFDGMWDHTEAGFDWRLAEQYALIKKLQPNCMIGNNHHGSPIGAEDFQLFEQDLPGENNAGFSGNQQVSKLPLETCMTMNNSWGYNINDRNYKSSDEVIRKLVGAAGRNANFLLNVGPRPDGQIPTQQQEILKHVGEFMRQYGSTIYNTRGGCVPPQEWGVTTQQGKTLYIHILNQEKDGQVVNLGVGRINGGSVSFLLPLKGASISSITMKDGGTPIQFQREGEGYRIMLPRRPDSVDVILVAKLN